MPSGGQTLTFYLLALVVGVLGWLATHLVGKPFLAYRAVRADIARCLVLYANVPPAGEIDIPVPPHIKARAKYRELASELVACSNTIAFYQVWSAFKIIPTQEELYEVKGDLIALSNSVGEEVQYDAISERENNMRRLLRIKLAGD